MSDDANNKEDCFNLGLANDLFNLNACGKRYSKNLRRRLLPKYYANESDWYDDDGNINTFCDGVRRLSKFDLKSRNSTCDSIAPPMEIVNITEHCNKQTIKASNSTYWQNPLEPKMPQPNVVPYYSVPQNFIPVVPSSIAVGLPSIDVTNNKTFIDKLHVHNQKLKDENRAIKELVRNQFAELMNRLEEQQIELERQDQELYQLELSVVQTSTAPSIISSFSILPYNVEMLQSRYPLSNNYCYS